MQDNNKVSVNISKENNRSCIEQRLCLATTNLDWFE